MNDLKALQQITGVDKMIDSRPTVADMIRDYLIKSGLAPAQADRVITRIRSRATLGLIALYMNDLAQDQTPKFIQAAYDESLLMASSLDYDDRRLQLSQDDPRINKRYFLRAGGRSGLCRGIQLGIESDALLILFDDNSESDWIPEDKLHPTNE